MADKCIKFSIYPQKYIDASNITIVNNSGTEQGVKSAALGSISFGQLCTTCGLSDKCPGHTGKFKIDYPIFKSGFKNSIQHILQLICPICCNIKNIEIIELLDEIEKNKSVILPIHRKKFEKLYKVTDKQSKKICCQSFCNNASTSIQYNEKISAFVFKTNEKNIISNEKLYEAILNLPNIIKQLIVDDDEELFSPENIFYTNNLMIPPNSCRPPNIYGDTVSEVFTTLLQDLVKSDSKNLQKNFNHVDNNPKKKTYTSEKQFTLEIPTNGSAKDSLLRGNICGKRVSGTGRAVIGPSSNIIIGTTIYPDDFLHTLRDSIYVNQVTKKFLTEELKKPQEYRRIKYRDLVKVSPLNKNPYKIISLNDSNNVCSLSYGDYLECEKSPGSFMVDGRQPSLHQTNIKANVIVKDNAKNPDKKSRTIKMHPNTAGSENADFDGDEKKIDTFQGPSSNIEMGLIMNTRNQMKHPLIGTTVFGFVQDQIIGTGLLLNEEVIPRKKVLLILGKHVNLLFESNYEKTKKFFSGKEIISLLFPKFYTLDGIVENGMIIIDKFETSHVTANSYKSIFNGYSQYYGTEATLNFMDMFKDIVNNYIRYYGLSVKMSDIIPDTKLLTEIKLFVQKNVNEIDNQINNIIKDVNDKKLSITSNNDLVDFKMSNIDLLYNKVLKFIKEEIFPKYYNDSSNQFKKCIESKYKVSEKDVISFLAYVGQQKNSDGIPEPNVNGKSLLFGRKNDLSLKATGFVSNCLVSGITYCEYATDIKYNSLPQIVQITSGTAIAGYIGRKMVKCNSELVVDHDRFIVSSKSVVINPNTNFLKISMRDTSKVLLHFPKKEMTWYDDAKKIFDEKILDYVLQKNGSRSVIIKEIDFYLNMNSEIMTYYYENEMKKIPLPDENEIKKRIDDFYEYINDRFYFGLNDISSVKYILYCYLNPSGCYFENKKVKNYISMPLVNSILNKIEKKLRFSLSPGTMIGYQIANTIQELITQQSLSSFHSSTKSGSNIDRGILETFHRLVDFSNKPENRKKDEDVVTLHSYDEKKLTVIKNYFEYISLRNICNNITIIKESVNTREVVYKITIDISMLLDRNIPITTIYKMFKTYCDSAFCVSEYFVYQSLDENTNELVVLLHTKLDFDNKVMSGTFDLVKNYFLLSLWDGVHKGRKINTRLSINSSKTIILEEYKPIEKELFELKFFVSSLNDFELVNTKELDFFDLPPWLSYDNGGMQFMKNNIVGKLNLLVNNVLYTTAIRQFSDFRFGLNKPLSIKVLYEKNEIIKSMNHGAGNNFVHQVSFGHKTDKCKDMYSSLLVGQRPTIGTNYFNFLVDPNKFDKLKNIDENENYGVDNEEGIISLF